MSLVDELDSKITSGKGKAMFLAQLDEIEAAFNKGYSRIVIWKHLNDSGKMPMTYRSFAIYVRQYITAKDEQAPIELKNSMPDKSEENVTQSNPPSSPIIKAENTVFDVLKMEQLQGRGAL